MKTILHRVSVDEDDVEYDGLEVDIILAKPLPEVLPINGRRIKFYYPGIKTLCLRCYESGHPKWECPQVEKTNWLEYVYQFYQLEEVSDDMLGGWVDLLKQYHPELQPVKPIFGKHNKDLRKNLDEHREYNRSHPPVHQKPRGRGRAPFRGGPRGQRSRPYDQNHIYPEEEQSNYYPQNSSNRGRGGCGRGRGIGPNRGSFRGKPTTGYSNKFGSFY